MLNEFRRNGYVRVSIEDRSLFEAFNAELSNLIIHYCRMEKLEVEEGRVFHEGFMRLDRANHDRIHQIYNILKNSNTIYDIVTMPNVTRTAKELLDLARDDPLYYFFHVCRMDPPGDEKFILRWHQEDYGLTTKRGSVRVWAPLVERNGPENGSMDILVGSHQAGELPHHIAEKDGYSSLYIPDEYLDFSTYERKTVDMEPGELLFLDPNLIHKSNYNPGSNVRYSLAVHITNPKHESFQLSSKQERSRLSRQRAVNYEELRLKTGSTADI